MPILPLVALVDDDAAIREALSDLLLALGFDCRAYPQAEAFLQAHLPGLFHALVTDIRMPGMGGLALLRRIRLLEPSMPVIVITAATDADLHQAVLQEGARASLVKPISGDDLLRHLQEPDQDGRP